MWKKTRFPIKFDVDKTYYTFDHWSPRSAVGRHLKECGNNIFEFVRDFNVSIDPSVRHIEITCPRCHIRWFSATDTIRKIMGYHELLCIISSK